MAKKRETSRVIKATPTQQSAPADGADDLEILHPERSTTIAGRAITMREYGFVEGLKLAPLYGAFVDALQVKVLADGVPPLHEILDLVAAHHETIVELVAIACDSPPDWVRGLNDQDGMNLLYLWWAVDAPFFMRRVFDRIAAAKVVEAVRAGAMSTQSSSQPTTAQNA